MEVENKNDRAEYFATFSPQTINLLLNSLHKLDGENWLKFSFSTQAFKGDNFITSKGGKTYLAEENKIKVSMAYLNQHSKGITNFDTGVKGELTEVKQHDVLSSTLWDIKNLNIQSYFQKSFLLKENLSINPFAEVGYNFNLTSEFENGNLDYLENISEDDYSGMALRDFYAQVIYPDFELLNTNAFNFSAGASVDFRPSGKLSTLFNVRGGLKSPLGEMQYFQSAHPNRFYASAALTLYY